VNGQDYVFKVLASKGTNQIKTTSGTTKLYTGSTIKNGDKIILSENSYVGLAHKSGKTIELKKQGEYDINSLLKTLSIQNSSTTNKYVNYIAGEIKKTENDDMAKNRYKYMSVVGSVERSTDQISLFAPHTAQAYDKVYLIWTKVEKETEYSIEIENLFGERVGNIITHDTTTILNLNNLKDKFFVIKIKGVTTNTTSDIYQIRFPSDENREIIRKELESLQIDDTTPIGKLLLASFYEEKKIYYEALKCYQDAVQMEPTVDDYQIARGQFIERTTK
jgi:hypothetical protein